MKTPARRAAAALFAAVAAVAAAPAIAQNEDAAPEAAAFDATTVVATVGETEVTLGDLIRTRQGLEAQLQGLPAEVLFEGLLEQYTRQVLFAEAAEAAGLREDPETAAQIAAAERQVLADAYLVAALRARYDAAVAAGALGSEVVLSQIIMPTEAEAAEIKAELDAGGDFATLAQARSVGPLAAEGGALGAFDQSVLPPEFAGVVTDMQPGDVAGPIQTNFGFHVIRLDERRAGEPPSFSEWLSAQDEQTIAEAIEAARAEAEAAIPVTRAETLPPPDAIFDDSLVAQ